MYLLICENKFKKDKSNTPGLVTYGGRGAGSRTEGWGTTPGQARSV